MDINFWINDNNRTQWHSIRSCQIIPASPDVTKTYWVSGPPTWDQFHILSSPIPDSIFNPSSPPHYCIPDANLGRYFLLNQRPHRPPELQGGRQSADLWHWLGDCLHTQHYPKTHSVLEVMSLTPTKMKTPAQLHATQVRRPKRK